MFTLRNVLRLDAAASGGLGLLLLVLFSPVESELGLPVALSLTVGALLLGWAAFVAWVAVGLRASYVREVIALNVVYVLGSVLFAVSGWVELTDLGVAFVLAQALAVLVLTVEQLLLSRTGQAVAA